jgi:toxin-antitoxin system PIN domain toxin
MKEKPFLLDVNLLLALAWPNHLHHREAASWFANNRRHGFRTCPITQTGFVRISSNPAFTPDAVSPLEAVHLLARIADLPGHDFWPDDLSVPAAIAESRILGHRQLTDLYLLKLTANHGGVFATLDRGAAALAKSESLPAVLVG